MRRYPRSRPGGERRDTRLAWLGQSPYTSGEFGVEGPKMTATETGAAGQPGGYPAHHSFGVLRNCVVARRMDSAMDRAVYGQVSGWIV